MREQSEAAVGAEGLAVGGVAAVPDAPAVVDEGDDGDSDGGAGGDGEGDGEVFVGRGGGLGRVRDDKRGDVGWEGSKGDW